MAYAILDQYYLEGSNADIVKLIERSMIEFEIPLGTKVIGAYAFAYSTNLERVNIPEGVTTIGASCFENTSISDLALPLSCKKIESWGLSNITKLESIMLGRVEELGPSSFYNCAKCTEYDFSRCKVIPSLANINVFTGINSEANIFVPPELYNGWKVATNWVAYADYIVPIYEAPEIPDPGYDSEGLEFAYGDEWGSGENQYSLMGRGFCTDSVVVIPDHYNGPLGDYEVTSIRNEFWGDGELTEIYFPETIKRMWSGALYDCPNLKKIYIPGVANIASLQLCGLPSLEYVRFGEDLYYIGEGSINVEATNAVFDFSACKAIPQLEGYNYSQFGTDPIIYVPKKLYSKWIAASNWSKYANYIYPAK